MDEILIDLVIEQIEHDIKAKDVTSIHELLKEIPEDISIFIVIHIFLSLKSISPCEVKVVLKPFLSEDQLAKLLEILFRKEI